MVGSHLSLDSHPSFICFLRAPVVAFLLLPQLKILPVVSHSIDRSSLGSLCLQVVRERVESSNRNAPHSTRMIAATQS